jgi:hypothetical protein
MWLRALGESMEELRTEEAFRQAEIIAVGAGKLEKSALDRVTRRWRSAFGEGGGTIRLQGKKSDLMLLRNLGIGKHQDEPR